MFLSPPNLYPGDIDKGLGRLNHTGPPRGYLLWHRNGIRWRKTAMDSGLEGNTKEGEIYRCYKNELDSDELSDEEALRAYKEQQYAERGFRFLKDPFFFADSMFLKNESRIVAMVMIMGLALIIHSLAERKLRETPEKKDAVSQPLPLFHPKSREKRE